MPTTVITRPLTHEETSFSRAILALSERDPSSEEIPLKVSVAFASCSGLEMDIKVVNSDSPYVDPVVFFNGHEVLCLDPAEALEGKYTFDYDGRTFSVVLVPAFPVS